MQQSNPNVNWVVNEYGGESQKKIRHRKWRPDLPRLKWATHFLVSAQVLFDSD